MEELKEVKVKDLKKGENYYDVDDLDFATEYKFISKNWFSCKFKYISGPRPPKMDKNGIVKIGRIVKNYYK